MHPKKVKTKKSKSKLGATYGMIEGEKRRLSKETSLVIKEIPAEVVIEEHIQKADPKVQESLKGILEDYHDIFPSNLPYEPPPKRQLDHAIDMILGESPPYKSPYKLSSTEWKNYGDRWSCYNGKDGSDQVQSRTALPFFPAKERWEMAHVH